MFRSHIPSFPRLRTSTSSSIPHRCLTQLHRKPSTPSTPPIAPNSKSSSTPPPPPPLPQAKQSLSERMKDLYRKYGKVAIYFHFTVWFATYGAMYLLVDQGVDVNKLLAKIGMGKTEEKAEKVVAEAIHKIDANAGAMAQYWTAIKNSETAKKMVLAFALLKLTGPFRTLLTLSITPTLAKALAKRGWVKLVKP